jgi:hypothetical protein
MWRGSIADPVFEGGRTARGSPDTRGLVGNSLSFKHSDFHYSESLMPLLLRKMIVAVLSLTFVRKITRHADGKKEIERCSTGYCILILANIGYPIKESSVWWAILS